MLAVATHKDCAAIFQGPLARRSVLVPYQSSNTATVSERITRSEWVPRVTLCNAEAVSMQTKGRSL